MAKDDRIFAAIFEIFENKIKDFEIVANEFLQDSEQELKIHYLAKLIRQFPLRFFTVNNSGGCFCLECWASWKGHGVELKRKEGDGKIRFFCPETDKETIPYILPDQQKASFLAHLHTAVLLEAQKIAAGLMVATIELLQWPDLVAKVQLRK